MAVARPRSRAGGIAGIRTHRGGESFVHLVRWLVVGGKLPEVMVVVGDLAGVLQAVDVVAVVGNEVVLDLGLGLGLGLDLDLGRAPDTGPRYNDGV